jgi:hypothetical protein
LFLTGIKAHWAEGGIKILLSEKCGGVIALEFRFHLDPQLTRSKLNSAFKKFNFAGLFET